LIQRQAELASVVEAIAGLTQRTEALGQAIKALAEERALLETEESGLAAEVRKRTAAESEARDWAKSIEHELGRTRRDAARLTSERASLMTQEFDLGPPVDIEAAQAARDAAWAEHSGHVLDREAVKERLHAAREALFEAQSTVAERQRRLVSVRALEASRQVRFKEIGPQRRRLAEELSKAKLETEELERTLGSLAAQIEEANSERRLAVQESQFSRHREAAARQAADAQRRRLHEAELKAARAEGRRAAALGRLLEDYGLSEAEAMGTAPSEPSPQASQRAASLRREIKAMGEVNLGAVAAYEGLMGRIGELSGQRKDVLAAARDIEAGIRELDLLTRQRFDETFEQVRAHFSQVFHRLFGGGEASLDLVDGEGFLDAGIEIQVTVPGKKRQRLELLSGGERALSAIAFLFALLRSRPSPIVILDEVDAPLDGRNVDRFVSLMRETSRESQFILVTHNPVTIESADVWLGVTMQEPGVSSLVPYRAGPVVA
jgi:chromosome segregation protein